MKKYLLLLALSISALCAVNAATFTYSSVSPLQSVLIGNYDTIKIKFSTPIKANPNNTTLTRGTVTVSGVAQYSRLNGFYSATTGTVLSTIVRINPSDNTELQILLKDCSFNNGDAITISVGSRSVYSLDDLNSNSTINLSYTVGDGPTKFFSPSNSGFMYGSSDTLVVGCNSKVYFSEDPALYFEITHNGTSIWKKSSAEFVANNLGSIINNKLYIHGYPAFTDGSTYKVTIDPGFLLTNHLTMDGYEIQNGVPLNDWVFTASFLSVSGYSPSPGNLAGNNTTALNITFNHSVQIVSGTVEIWNYVSNSLAYTISAAQLSLTNSSQTLVIPHTALAAGVKYFVKISPSLIKSSSTLATFSGISNKDTWSFTTDVFKIWVGGSDSDWNNSGNWSGGTLPVSGSSVKIVGGGNPCILSSSTPISLNHLSIAETGKLTISAASTITLSGDFSMLSLLNTDLNALSNNSSCIINGALNVDPAKVFIYQEAENQIVTNSFMYSSPVTSTSGSLLGIPSSISLFKYDNPTASYLIVPSAETWVVGRGYAAKLTQPIVFTGVINNNSSYFLPTAQSFVGGNPAVPSTYNLLGNPYTAAISWLQMVDLAQVYPTVWIWSGYKWVIINSTGGGSVTGSNDPSDLTIPRGHGFFVRAVNGFNGNVEVKKSHLVNNSNSHLKGAVVSNETIRLTAINGQYEDDILIGFNPNAGNGYELYDSEKLNYPDLGNPNFVQIASFADGYAKGLSLNIKPQFVDNMSYNIEMVANTAGTYSLVFTDINANLESQLNVFLVDSIAPDNISTIAIKKGDSYPFTTAAKVDSKRFKLLLVKKIPTSIKTEVPEDGVNIFYSSMDIFINSKRALSGNFSVYDIQGCLVKQVKLDLITQAKIPFNVKGVFVVQVIENDGVVISKKIVVN